MSILKYLIKETQQITYKNEMFKAYIDGIKGANVITLNLKFR